MQTRHAWKTKAAASMGGGMIEYIAEHWVSHFNYWAAVFMMMAGLYAVISRCNLIKKIVGLNIFQTAVFLLYISVGVVTDGTAPIAAPGFAVYSNPLPHVLILTAIVVGVATTALAFALVARISRAYQTLEEDELRQQDDKEENIEQW